MYYFKNIHQSKWHHINLHVYKYLTRTSKMIFCISFSPLDQQITLYFLLFDDKICWFNKKNGRFMSPLHYITAHQCITIFLELETTRYDSDYYGYSRILVCRVLWHDYKHGLQSFFYCFNMFLLFYLLVKCKKNR